MNSQWTEILYMYVIYVRSRVHYSYYMYRVRVQYSTVQYSTAHMPTQGI